MVVESGRSRVEDGSTVDPSEYLPDCDLSLEHVYGYSCGLRNVVFYGAKDDLIYPAGNVAVIQTTHTLTKLASEGELPTSQKLFCQHQDTVCCLAVHPSKQFVATGSQPLSQANKYNPSTESCVLVWSTETLQVLVRLHAAQVSPTGMCCTCL